MVVIVSKVDVGSFFTEAKVLCPLSLCIEIGNKPITSLLGSLILSLSLSVSLYIYIYDTGVFLVAKFHHLATQNKGRGAT